MALKRIFLIISLVLAGLLIAGIGYLFYLYSQGGNNQYTPPAIKEKPPLEETIANLTLLSDAVEAYYVKTMEYPEKLELMIPEFIGTLPVCPHHGQAYQYETDGIHRYRITDPEASTYQLKELYIENGTLTKN
ncbi:MAG: hypothetical protein KBA26_04860 [Candidatus Delongbacteria bacterium]|nr:hypothetical protein [Candidatus Delongbacteria bacterium]